MVLQNIVASNSDDVFYRYKMPKLITKIKGRGTGIKMNIVNMSDVAKALARPASYITMYFGCELGARSMFDEKTGVSLVDGSHDTAKLAGLLENFIKKYVQCYDCGNLGTEILITKTQMVQLNCFACGFVSDVDMTDKLTSFILKNPPEQKENSKEKPAKRSVMKFLKEGEAAGKVMMKLTKDGPGKARNGSDKENVSPTVSQVGVKDDCNVKDDIIYLKDKLTSFTFKNPSEQKENFKDKLATRALKEFLKESVAADKVMKKLTEDVMKTKDGPEKATSKADKGKVTVIHTGVKNDFDEEDDGQWLIDTSAEAAFQHIIEQLSMLTKEVPVKIVAKPDYEQNFDPWKC